MNIRKATAKDLPALGIMYQAIIADMEKHDIRIWDDVYPFQAFIEDIKEKRLYVLEEENELLCAFALCVTTGGIETMKWAEPNAEARYIERLGVNVSHLRKGIGAKALRMAMSLSKEEGASYLRLFVVDKNKPAIDLYRKVGFDQVKGLYQKFIFGDFLLTEYGFEIATDKCR